jgi:hypothetical protein
MVFKLKCKACGNIVFYDSNAKQDTYRKCGKCEQPINMNIESKLDNVADMQGFELIGIERSFSSKLLAEDLSNIEKIFDNANDDNQKIIVNIIDKLYLMLNRDDDTTLNEIEKLLSKYFLDSCGKTTEL